MMSWSPRYYIPMFMEIDQMVLDQNFLMVFTICGHGGHLGHVISIMSLNFNFLEPKSLHTKFWSKWPTGDLGKASFDFHK